jgi:hypothetical protein
MKKWILSSLVLFLPFSLSAQEEQEDFFPDQFSLCLGGTYYLVAKAMDIAQDHGYPYVKILSYALQTEHGLISFSSSGECPEGERFESIDKDGKLEVVCFRENTHNCFCIHLDDYADELDEDEDQ